ncbi:uncharacterized protein LOC133518377 [Cydia pomonella]|uniref:uncharacterized protein LOC133518377 n=1 Tax=Cydia pomonella TaxID=82600 RepID=UPI002ADD73CD|nr:uncharacterized protein LOC133518377 [Cydia pomonella]
MDAAYNVWYALVVASVAVSAAREYPGEPITRFMKVGFVMDVVSYLHYVPIPHQHHVKTACYFIRVHRPLRFIWTTDRDTMNSSLLVTTLKYIYYTFLLRVVCAYFWMYLVGIKMNLGHPPVDAQRRMMQLVSFALAQTDDHDELPEGMEMLFAMYIVNKIFIPIGYILNHFIS